MRVTAGGEDEPGVFDLSYSAIILGSPSVKPYSPCDRATGALFPAAISKVSLSMSQLRQTATFAPLGQLLGVSFRPARMGATHSLSCSSVSLMPGCGLFSCCACNPRGTALSRKATTIVFANSLFMIPSCCGSLSYRRLPGDSSVLISYLARMGVLPSNGVFPRTSSFVVDDTAARGTTNR